MAFRKGLIHAIAECHVCGQRWEDWKTAQKLASAHHRKTGHTVRMDLGYAGEYYSPPSAERKGAQC